MNEHGNASWNFLLIVLGAILIAIVVLSNKDKNQSSTSSGGTSYSAPASVGEERQLSADGPMYVATTKEAFRQWLKVVGAKDKYGFIELVAAGLLFKVEEGTKVLVIDSSVFSREVRILDGEYVGRSGWVPYEWVQ